ncbi:MAG: cytochrome ubiquinol oxidase subunit I, partial [Pseudomonadota bacterium]
EAQVVPIYFDGQNSRLFQLASHMHATLRTGLVLGAVLIPIQIVVGDLHGLNTLEHQPAKVAAMEGLWETRSGAPLVLFGLPDEDTQSNRLAIEIPKLASFVLTHDPDGVVQGIDAFPDAHPPVATVFWSFRVMVGTGLLMLAVSWLGLWTTRRGRAPTPLLAKALLGMTFSGWVAVLAGWFVTEVGRQPFLVAGVLRTAEAASTIGAGAVGFSLALYLLMYVGLIAAYISVLFFLARRANDTDERARPPEALGPAVMPPVLPSVPSPSAAPS